MFDDAIVPRVNRWRSNLLAAPCGVTTKGR